MDYPKIKKYISEARLLRYEVVCHNDTRRALKLYQANLRLSQSFYPLLALLEVVLRNALNEQLTLHFNNPEWLKNEALPNGFMSHQSLGNQFFLQKSVQKILRNHTDCSHGKIIADLSFGFWTDFFEKTPYKLLQGRPIQIFNKLPAGTNRHLINQKLNNIRKFRNRISHHEPIVFEKDINGNPIFSTQEASSIYAQMMEIFNWLDLDFDAWTRKINTVPFEIERVNLVYKKYPRWQYFFKRLHLGFQHYYNRYF